MWVIFFCGYVGWQVLIQSYDKVYIQSLQFAWETASGYMLSLIKCTFFCDEQDELQFAWAIASALSWPAPLLGKTNASIKAAMDPLFFIAILVQI